MFIFIYLKALEVSFSREGRLPKWTHRRNGTQRIQQNQTASLERIVKAKRVSTSTNAIQHLQQRHFKENTHIYADDTTITPTLKYLRQGDNVSTERNRVDGKMDEF